MSNNDQIDNFDGESTLFRRASDSPEITALRARLLAQVLANPALPGQDATGDIGLDALSISPADAAVLAQCHRAIVANCYTKIDLGVDSGATVETPTPSDKATSIGTPLQDTAYAAVHAAITHALPGIEPLWSQGAARLHVLGEGAGLPDNLRESCAVILSTVNHVLAQKDTARFPVKLIKDEYTTILLAGSGADSST